MEKARRQAVGKAAMTARACGKQKAKHLRAALVHRSPLLLCICDLIACDVPVVSPPVPVVHVPDATVAAHGEPVSVAAEAAEWTGIIHHASITEWCCGVWGCILIRTAVITLGLEHPNVS